MVFSLTSSSTPLSHPPAFELSAERRCLVLHLKFPRDDGKPPTGLGWGEAYERPHVSVHKACIHTILRPPVWKYSENLLQLLSPAHSTSSPGNTCINYRYNIFIDFSTPRVVIHNCAFWPLIPVVSKKQYRPYQPMWSWFIYFSYRPGLRNENYFKRFSIVLKYR